jgi:hypothetical protein
MEGKMKADCQNCEHFAPDVEMQMKLGSCTHPHVNRPITSFNARNCDGFGFVKREDLQGADANPQPCEISVKDMPCFCEQCGVHHG